MGIKHYQEKYARAMEKELAQSDIPVKRLLISHRALVPSASSYKIYLVSALVAVEQWLLLAVHVRVGHTKSLPLTSNFDSLDSAQLILNPNFLDAAHHPLLNSQFSILNSQFPILNSRFSILNSQF